MAARFAVGSSRTAVCGQLPVSTPTMRSASRMPAERAAEDELVLVREDVVGDDAGL